MKRFTVVLAGLIFLMFTFQANAESPFIYGIHDHDTNPQEYLDHIRNGGATGWVTATVAIGSNPNDHGGADFSSLSNQGHSVIVRLNNGYGNGSYHRTGGNLSYRAKRASDGEGILIGRATYFAAGISAESWLALDLGAVQSIYEFVVYHADAAGERTYYNIPAYRFRLFFHA